MPKLRIDKKRTAHVFNSKWRSSDVVLKEEADFASLLLSERVLKGLKKAGFKKPSPIQLEAIPFGRYGKDLFIQAKSGTGKTLVFTIVALEMLQDIRCPQVLILAPTREIADQIREVIASVGVAFKTLTCCSFIGGIPMQEDRAKGHSCQIAVGTPGRVKQLISEGILPTNSIRLFVLDEADVLLSDKSFVPTITDIFQSLPKEKQVIATSATYPSSIKKIITNFFRDPYLARLEKENLSLLGTIHYEQEVQPTSSVALVYKFKFKTLEKILERVKFSQCLVFCNQITMVELLCNDIKKLGFTATYISSAKEQIDRLKAIDALKRFKCKILICTDLTSRGIDAENVDLIINFDCPNTLETYLHRVGRAGRYGSRGVAITFRTKAEKILFRRFQKGANFEAYYLPNPLIEDLINFIPKNLNGSNNQLENQGKEQSGQTGIINNCGDNTNAEMNSEKTDAESIILSFDECKENLQNLDVHNKTADQVENSKFEFVNEMKSEGTLTPNRDQNLLLRNTDDVEEKGGKYTDHVEKKRGGNTDDADKKGRENKDAVGNEAEENENFKMELFPSTNINVILNHTEDIKIETKVENVHNCNFEEVVKVLCVDKISVKNENNCEQFKTESSHLLGVLNNLPIPNSFPETNSLTQQTSNANNKEMSNKQENSVLNEPSYENDQGKRCDWSGNVINNSVSKFISNYVGKKSGHSLVLNNEEITQNDHISCMPFATKKFIIQKDVNILRSCNSNFFYNVLVDHFNDALNENNFCIKKTDKKDLIKDHPQLHCINENFSKKDINISLDPDKLSSDFGLKPSFVVFSNGDQLNTISAISSADQVGLKNLSDEKHTLEGTPNLENTTSHDENAGSFMYLSLKSSISSMTDILKGELNQSSDHECNTHADLNSEDSEWCSFDDSEECSFKSEPSYNKSGECSYDESGEYSDDESEASSEESEESSGFKTEESSDESEEYSSNTESGSTDVSGSVTSLSSRLEHASSTSSDSDTNLSSVLETASTTSSESDTNISSGLNHASSKSSRTSFQNKKHKSVKSNKEMMMKRERFRAGNSHLQKHRINDNLYCSSSSCCPSLSDSALKKGTRKTFVCDSKANVITKCGRKGIQEGGKNQKTNLAKSSQMPFYKSITSSCPRENYSPDTCCSYQQIKYPNYGHSSKLNSAQCVQHCYKPSNQHFVDTTVCYNKQDYLCKLWYQIFCDQYFWIQHTSSNFSKKF